MSSGKKPKAPCQIARVGEERGFFGLPACVIKSPAYQDLSVHARAVLTEIGVRMDGYNNGRIGVDHRSVRKSLGCSPRKVVESFAQLMENGFIDCTFDGSYGAKLAREYRLTFVSTPRGPATNDYLLWTPRPKKSSATDAVSRGGRSATYAVATPPGSATDAVTRRIRKAQNCVKGGDPSASDAVAHLYQPVGRDDEEASASQSDRPIDPSFCGGPPRSGEVVPLPSARSTCARCGDEFDQVGTKVTRRFCSDACRSLANDGKATIGCEQCGGDVEVTRTAGVAKRFCSETCRKRAERERARERARVKAQAG